MQISLSVNYFTSYIFQAVSVNKHKTVKERFGRPLESSLYLVCWSTTTVIPTNSDSDVIFCLQLLS